MSKDEVFDKSRNPVFRGTPEETKQFIEEDTSGKLLDVVTNDDRVKTIPEYLGETNTGIKKTFG